MKIFSGLAIAALITGGCVDRERPLRKQMPGEVSLSNEDSADHKGAKTKSGSNDDYARQANKNAISGEDFPANEAPPGGGEGK